MKQILILIFTLFASLGYAQHVWVNKAKKAIVSIVTYDKDNKIINTGNGFFVKPDGTGVADYGIFDGSRRAVVIDSDGKEYPIDCILGANSMYDVVKFRIKTDKEVDFVTLAKDPSPIGSTVYLLPYASQKENTLESGTVDAVTQIEGKYRYYTLHLKTTEKAVSCPVTNANGEVIGMIQKSADPNTADSYALEASFAADLTMNALSRMDYTLNNIGIRKGLPEDEKQAQVFLMMSGSLKPEAYFELINEYIGQFPDSHDGYFNRANFYIENYKDEEHCKLAEEDIEKAIEVSGKKDDAYYNACKTVCQAVAKNIQYPSWNLEKAMEYIEKAYQINPIPLYVQIQGDVFFAMKDYEKAYTCYEKVNQSSFRSAESLFSAARTKQIMGADEEALALMDSTVNSFGTLLTEKAAPYVFHRAQMKASMEKYREAVLDYNEYEKLILGKTTAEFYYIREQAEMQCRLYQQALNDIEKAVSMDPRQIVYIVEQVALYTRFSQFDKAVKAAREGLAIASDNADLYRMMGFSQIQLKQQEEGKKNLLKARELGDKNAETILQKYSK